MTKRTGAWQTARIAIVLALAAAPVQAQTVVPPGVLEFEDAEIFRPTTDNGNFITVYDSPGLQPGQFSIGGYGDYARNPLEIQFDRSGDLFTRLVENMGTLQPIAAVGILPRTQIGLRLPFYLTDVNDVQADTRVGEGTNFNLGDLVANVKVTLLDHRDSPVGIAVIPEITFPTGNRREFAGTGKFGYGGLLALDTMPAENLVLGLNFGGLIRDKPGGGPFEDSDDDFNDQFRFGGAMSYSFSEQMTLIAEVYGAANTSKPFDEERKTPADAIGALRVHLGKVDLTLGGGAGLTRGQGSPDFRIFFGVTPPRPQREQFEKVVPAELGQSRKTYNLDDRDRDGRPSPGDVLEYTIHLVNSGAAPAVNVQVADPVPDHVTYIAGSLTVNGHPVTDATDGDAGEVGVGTAAPVVNARIQRIDPNGEGLVSFRVAIDPEITTITKVVNQATVAADNIPAFPLPPAETTIFPKSRETEHVIVTPERLELTEEIHFEFDKATIQKVSYPILHELAQVLKNYPTLRIRVEGNTDSVGSESYNQRLSELRAKSVRDFLIGLGIEQRRMEWLGRGESSPIATNETAAGRAKNRRTEFIVLNPEALGGKHVERKGTAEDVAPQSEPAWLKEKGPQGRPENRPETR